MDARHARGVVEGPRRLDYPNRPDRRLRRHANYSVNFKDLDDAGQGGRRFATTGGWIGFTDKYWLTALIPGQNTQVDSGFRAANGRYQADMALPSPILPAGKAVSTTTRPFPGPTDGRVLARNAKEQDTHN